MKPDPGHVETDKLLAEMEKKVSRVYREAMADTEAKLADYMRRFEIKDEKWRAMVASGEKTAKEYQQWRTGQIMMGKRWTDMRDALAEDYHNANLIARSVVNGYIPEVYAINHNFATYQIERAARVDTSYTLYSRESVERILREEPEILPPPGKRMTARIAAGKDIAWQEGQIQSVTMQGILQGESIPNLSKRIARTMGESNHASTIRYARTAVTGAQNAGRMDAYKRAEDMGIDVQKTWVATLDGRTRHEHRMLDRQTRPVDEPFEVDGYKIMVPGDPSAEGFLIWNCFPGKTKVASDSGIVRSYKNWYEGELVEIETAGGAKFACTPNHPILSPHGWVSAASLNCGDNILVTSGVNTVDPWGNPCVDKAHTSIQTLHHFLKLFFGFERRPRSRVNFHGDIPASDVEIVSKKRLLMRNWDTGDGQGVNKLIFKFSDALVLCKGHLVSCLWRIYISALRFMRGGGKALTFFWRRLGHTGIHGLGTVSDVNVPVAEYTIDNLPAETEIRSELLDGLTGKIFLDHVVFVKVSPFCGHVYNLQTENGYYFVESSRSQSGVKCNGIKAIAKNCRCTTIAEVKGLSHNWDTRSDAALDGMSYDEWKESREERSDSIYKQEQIAEAMRHSYIWELYRGRRNH